MSMLRKVATAGGVLAGVALAGVAAAPAAAAGTVVGVSTSHAVFVVKDQAGGAFYNVATGERYDVIATSIAPTLAVAGIQAADGAVLTATGALVQPLAAATAGTPADQVVGVVATSGDGTYADTSTGAQYDVSTVGAAIPATNDLALRTATGAILTIDHKVLLPVEAATGVNR